MSGDLFAGFLCAWCSCSAAPLCERCKAIVASGVCRGPLPPSEIERAPTPHTCCLCRGERADGATTARYCDHHRTSGVRRRGKQRDPWNAAPDAAPTPRRRAYEGFYVR